ncbi:MAG: hypothetical protein AAGA70_07025 [Pseudomonadota bacterium]
MRSKLPKYTALLLAATLAACSASDPERAGLGAVAGGVAMAALSGPIVAGTLVGVGAGALCDDFGAC